MFDMDATVVINESPDSVALDSSALEAKGRGLAALYFLFLAVLVTLFVTKRYPNLRDTFCPRKRVVRLL